MKERLYALNKSNSRKAYTAVNTHLILHVVLLLVFVGVSVACAKAHELAPCIVSGVLTLLPIFTFLISPLYFVFDEDSVKIVFCFGLRETVPWRAVRSISLMGSWILIGGGPPHYVLSYPQKDKKVFFVTGEVPKTCRTKKLIKRFYKKDIV